MTTSRSIQTQPLPAHEAAWLEEVRRKAASLRFGQVTVTIHDGRVVQLEVSEKTRFETLPGPAGPR